MRKETRAQGASRFRCHEIVDRKGGACGKYGMCQLEDRGVDTTILTWILQQRDTKVAEDTNKWTVYCYSVTELRVPQKVVQFLSSWATNYWLLAKHCSHCQYNPAESDLLPALVLNTSDHVQSGGKPPTFRMNQAQVHRTATRHIPNDATDNPPWQPHFWVMMSSGLRENSTLPRHLSTIYNPTRRHNPTDSLHEPKQSFGPTVPYTLLEYCTDLTQFFNFPHQQHKRGYNVNFWGGRVKLT